MAFTDWVFEKSSSGIVTSTDIFTPIAGTGSLQVDHLSGSDLFMNTYNDTYVRGIIKGRIRTMIEPVTLSGPGTYMAGFVFMQSQDDLTGSTSVGTGDAYGVFYTTESGGMNTQIFIKKYIGGLVSFPGGTTIASGTNFGLVAPGVISAMEVEWDATSGTQVDFVVSVDIMAVDFSGLVVDIPTVSDTVSPLVTTFSEGLATVSDVSSTMSWRFDNTTIFSVL